MSIIGLMLAVFLWGSAPALAFRERRPGFALLLLWNLAGLLLLFFVTGQLSPERHTEDSFWTLTPLARTGLAAISGLLLLAGAWLAYRAALRFSAFGRKRTSPALAFLVNLVLTPACTLAVTLLSPQLYYQYYRLIIPDLPQQWVLRGMEQISEILAALSFATESRFSDLAVGSAFWLLLAITISVHAVTWRERRRS